MTTITPKKNTLNEQLIPFCVATKILPEDVQEYIWKISQSPPSYSPPMAPQKTFFKYKPSIFGKPMRKLNFED